MASAPWTFFTVAVYQHNWGLTDQTKSEYQIQISADNVPRCTAVFCEGASNGQPRSATNLNEVGARIDLADGSSW